MFLTNSEKNIQIRIIIDGILLIIAAVVVSLFYIDILTPYKRGFFCDDETIKYPHHPSTVTDWMLYVFSFIVGFLTIVFSDFTQRDDGIGKPVKICKFRMPHRYFHTVTATYVFVFGACITDILTNFVKYILGRLRPNFLDVCQPDFNCTSDSHDYIENYTCLNTDTYEVTDSRLSFPSGHSSIVSFTLLFSMIYLTKRMACSYSHLVKPVLMIIPFLWASFTEVSRIRDNKHHWSDVAGGTLLGLAIGYSLYCIRSDIFVPSSSKDIDKDENNVQPLSVLKHEDVS